MDGIGQDWWGWERKGLVRTGVERIVLVRRGLKFTHYEVLKGERNGREGNGLDRNGMEMRGL